MAGPSRIGAARPLIALGALALGAIPLPALAQVETVVVTAERKAEDIQTTPIAVTALTDKDLKERQVHSFRDLQFHVPSVTYTKHNFGGAQFQIRGITAQYGLGAAIAINENDIYLESPSLVSTDYFDTDRVEIARGPQSTSYGRAATGGSVNIITAKPDLDDFHARASVDYGTFNELRPDAMINIPLIDGELGVRLAVHGLYHDGYEKNVYASLGNPQVFPQKFEPRINSLGTGYARFSVRWQPSENTTIDVFADGGYENDTRVRGDKRMCHRDPSGVLGCLPDKLAFENVNQYATFGALADSKQGGVASFALVDLQSPNGPGSNFCPSDPAHAYCQNPHDLLTVNEAYTPKYKGSGVLYGLNWKQTITDWLSGTLDIGWNGSGFSSSQSFTSEVPENLQAQIQNAVIGFQPVPLLAGGNPLVYDNAYFGMPGPPTPPGSVAPMNSHPTFGALPLSNMNYGGWYGSYSGSNDLNRGTLVYSPYALDYDQENYYQREWAGELRFQTKFDGPLQFSAGAFYMASANKFRYAWAETYQDFATETLGEFLPILFPQNLNQGKNLVGVMPYASIDYHDFYVQTRSAFLEGSYDIIPDELKVTAGARFNNDRAAAQLQGGVGFFGAGGAQLFFGPTAVDYNVSGASVDCKIIKTSAATSPELIINGAPAAELCFAPVGENDINRGPPLPEPYASNVANCTLQATANPDGTGGQINSRFPHDNPPPPQCLKVGHVAENDKWTGRVNIEWKPKLDFTDQTLVYAVASRGELAGGVNLIGIGTPVFPTTYKAATVDALEIGTKNTLLDSSLTYNLTFWYYNYENYQIGIIANASSGTINVPAHLEGLENEIFWKPDDALTFNASISLTQSTIGNKSIVDERNVGAGTETVGGVAYGPAFGNVIVIEDLTTGENCAVLRHPSTSAATPAEAHVNGFYTPQAINPITNPHGSADEDAPFGVPWVNFGTCNPSAVPTGSTVSNEQTLEANGFEYTSQIVCNPHPCHSQHDGIGIPVSLKGHRIPNTPFGQVGVGMQYDFRLWNSVMLTPRVDYYWQSGIYTRAWNDVPDRVSAWDVMNASIQLTGEDAHWYAKVFATNLFDKRNVTGAYLQDGNQGLYTNVFVEDPRVLGFSMGTSW
jgi:iron complex outermembrane receptor protein